MNYIYLLFSGLYAKVARKAGVDASYVSRVARGERNSGRVRQLLRKELELLHRDLGHVLKNGAPSRV